MHDGENVMSSRLASLGTTRFIGGILPSSSVQTEKKKLFNKLEHSTFPVTKSSLPFRRAPTPLRQDSLFC